MSNRFYRTTLHESLRNFLAFSSCLMFIRGTRTSSEYSCSPFCQASYEIIEEIKRTRTKRGFLERVDRRIYPPSADWPTAITDLPLVLDFAIWQKFSRIRSYLFVLSLFLFLSAKLMGPRAQLIQHDPLITIRSRNYPTRWPHVRASECLARSNVEVITFDCREIRPLRNRNEFRD